jgi:hypothetical protein
MNVLTQRTWFLQQQGENMAAGVERRFKLKHLIYYVTHLRY